MTAHKFHIGDILSVTTGRLVSPDHMSGVHALLDFLTGDALFTHQLPRAVDECLPHLRAQHPDLAAVEAPEFTSEAHVHSWLAEQVAAFGERRPVEPAPDGAHRWVDPLVELAAMRITGAAMRGGN